MINNDDENKTRRRTHIGHEDAKEVKEILSVVSSEIPALIKNIISSVFSEEAGRNMGKAAAGFYKELKDGGLPDKVALQMTENYMSTFTSLGDILKKVGKAESYKKKYSGEPERSEEVEE